MAFARHQFELSAPQDDGLSLLAHLEFVQKKTGKVHDLIANGPAMPRGCSQLWSDFNDLHRSRGQAGFGFARITELDLAAWQLNNEVRLGPWERACIRKVDDVWLAEFAPRPKEVGK